MASDKAEEVEEDGIYTRMIEVGDCGDCVRSLKPREARQPLVFEIEIDNKIF